MIKFKSFRMFQWYRRLAGGSWRKIGNFNWIPKAELEPFHSPYRKERYPDRPWTMKVAPEPAPDQQTPSPAPDPEQTAPSLVAEDQHPTAALAAH